MAVASGPLQFMDGSVEFAQILHQRVQLRVDPERGVLHGVTDLYVRPGRHRVIALHARNLQIDEVKVNGVPVQAHWLQRHRQRSVDESVEHIPQDFADYVADDYRAALKAERTQGDLAVPLDLPATADMGAAAAAAVAATAQTTVPTTVSSSPNPSSPSPFSGAHPAIQASEFRHCSETFRQQVLHDPQLASSVKLTIRYRKLGSDCAVRYLRGLMTTDTSLNRARGVVPCVDLPGSLHTWEVAVEAGLTDVAVCSGNLVAQRLLVGIPEPLAAVLPAEGPGADQRHEEQRAGEQEAGREGASGPLVAAASTQPQAEPGKGDSRGQMDLQTLSLQPHLQPQQQGQDQEPGQVAQVPVAASLAESAAPTATAMEVDAGAVRPAKSQGEHLQLVSAGAAMPADGPGAFGTARELSAGHGSDLMEVDGPRDGTDVAAPSGTVATSEHPDQQQPEKQQQKQQLMPPPDAPRTPAQAPPGTVGRPRPYAKVWYYEQPVAVAPCHLHVTVGPLAVVPQYQGSTNQLVETFLKQQLAGGAGAGSGAQDSTVITHFGLPDNLEQIQATTRFFYLPFKEYQIASTVNFPLSQLQVVFIPSELATAPVQVAAGCIVASSELLHSDRAVEAALTGKMALAEALARQWFGIILQPRSSSDVWLVEGLAGLLADQYFKAWLGQNEVAYRRFKEREAVLAGDDGQLPPLCPQNQYDDEDEAAEGPGAGAAAGQGPRRRRKDPLSQMYGSEALDPSPLRRWKAVAVLRMLEKRTGEDSFRSIMQALCRNAANALRSWSPSRPTGGPGGGGGGTRLLSTRRFVTECGTAAGMAKDVAAFAERWVYGRGCPRLTAGFSYLRRNNTLVVALKQEGGPEVAAAGRSASAQRSKSETSGRGVKVAVYDHDGAVQEVVVERMEAHVDAVVHEIEITTKPGGQRGRRKRGGAAAAGGDGDDDEGGGGTQQAAAAAVVDENRIPVQYFRVDPGQEWLCDVVVLQTEAMWAAQLRNSKDVVAQSLAVQGLMRLGLQLESSGAVDSSSVIGVLLEAVRGAGVYCRVRVEAARALAAFSASMSTQPAAPNLLSFFYDQCRDPLTGVLRPNYWADMGTHLVLQAIPACLATIRDVSFNSTHEAMQLITDILTNNDNSENLYDDSSYLAAVVEAAGLLRPTHASQLSRLLSLLDDFLLRDCLHPSHNYVVGAACLAALTSLALSVNPRQGRGAGAEAKALELYASVRRQLLRFANTATADAGTASAIPDATRAAIQTILDAATNGPAAAAAAAAAAADPAAEGAALGRATVAMAAASDADTAGALVCTATGGALPVQQGLRAPQIDHRQHQQSPRPPHHLLRRAAYQCLLRLEATEAKVMSSRRGAAAGGPEAKPASRVVVLALRLLASEPLPALRLAVMVEALQLLGSMQARVLEDAREEGIVGQPGALVVPVSGVACASLYRLALSEGEDPRIRHLAFMALQLIASQPTSLYRTSPEDALAAEEAAAEPSNVTGRPPKSHVTGHPTAAGGPARSAGTAGHATGTAGTAAAAAQAAPALKRIKMPLVRPGNAPPTAAASAGGPTASAAGGASGAEGSAGPGPGVAQGASQQQLQQTQPTGDVLGAPPVGADTAALASSPATSPMSVAAQHGAPSQPHSQGPSGDLPATYPVPDRPSTVPDLTPSTKATPPLVDSTAAAAAMIASASPSTAGDVPSQQQQLLQAAVAGAGTSPPPPPSTAGSPSPPPPPPLPPPEAVVAPTTAASPTSGGGAKHASRSSQRSPARDPRLAGGAGAAESGGEPPGAAAVGGATVARSGSPIHPNVGPGSRPTPPRPQSTTSASPPRPSQSPVAGRSPKRPAGAAGVLERGPSPTRPQSRFAPTAAAGAPASDKAVTAAVHKPVEKPAPGAPQAAKQGTKAVSQVAQAVGPQGAKATAPTEAGGRPVRPATAGGGKAARPAEQGGKPTASGQGAIPGGGTASAAGGPGAKPSSQAAGKPPSSAKQAAVAAHGSKAKVSANGPKAAGPTASPERRPSSAPSSPSTAPAPDASAAKRPPAPRPRPSGAEAIRATQAQSSPPGPVQQPTSARPAAVPAGAQPFAAAQTAAKSHPASANTSPQRGTAAPPSVPSTSAAPASTNTGAGPAAPRVRAWPSARPPRPDAAAAKADALAGSTGVGAQGQAQVHAQAPVGKAKAPGGGAAASVGKAAAVEAAAQFRPPSRASAGDGRLSGGPQPGVQSARPQQPQQRAPGAPVQDAAITTAAPGAAADPPAPSGAIAPTTAGGPPRALKIKIKPVGAVAIAAASTAVPGAGPGTGTGAGMSEHLQAALSRRMSVAGSTGGPPPVVADTPAPSLPPRASASKAPPAQTQVASAATPGTAAAAAAGRRPAVPAMPIVAAAGAQTPSSDAVPRPKFGLKIKMPKRQEANADLEPPAPAVSTASAAPPFRPRPALEADSEPGEGDVSGKGWLSSGKPPPLKRRG